MISIREFILVSWDSAIHLDISCRYLQDDPDSTLQANHTFYSYKSLIRTPNHGSSLILSLSSSQSVVYPPDSNSGIHATSYLAVLGHWAETWVWQLGYYLDRTVQP